MKSKTLGVMLDCSRNAVMKPEKVKEFAKLISDMGYNMLQLYTEDTYEIEGEPFFGHMRGRYSQEELQDIDSYCRSIGVELIPCIQVLAHLNQLVQWPAYRGYFDCNDILLVGDEKVYNLIEKMFEILGKCFTSRRVNIGMDEAHFLGRGSYQDKHGYRERIKIFTEHLARVKEIADKHGFTMMMWSDMFIRLNNNGQYENCEGEINLPQETIDSVPEGVELIYWDYYSKDKGHYDNVLCAHEKFKNPIGFAGGLQTWTGYAPNLQFALDSTEAAMRSVQEHSVDTVFFTLWGDKGKDCSSYTTLPVLFAAAFHNPCKYLLFNDPFIGIYDFTVRDDLSKRYADAAKKLEKSINGREYDYLFDMHKKLLTVLVRKCDLGVRLRRAYQTDDREVLAMIAEQDVLEGFCTVLEDVNSD